MVGCFASVISCSGSVEPLSAQSVGVQGPPGPPGPAGVSGYTVVNGTFSLPAAADTTVKMTLRCPQGTRPLNGGTRLDGGLMFVFSGPVGDVSPQDWEVSVVKTSGNTNAYTVPTWVICAQVS